MKMVKIFHFWKIFTISLFTSSSWITKNSHHIFIKNSYYICICFSINKAVLVKARWTISIILASHLPFVRAFTWLVLLKKNLFHTLIEYPLCTRYHGRHGTFPGEPDRAGGCGEGLESLSLGRGLRPLCLPFPAWLRLPSPVPCDLALMAFLVLSKPFLTSRSFSLSFPWLTHSC